VTPRLVGHHHVGRLRRDVTGGQGAERIGTLDSYAKCVFNGAQFGQVWPNSGRNGSLAVRSAGRGDPINGATCPDSDWRLTGRVTAVRVGGR